MLVFGTCLLVGSSCLQVWMLREGSITRGHVSAVQLATPFSKGRDRWYPPPWGSGAYALLPT